MNESPPPNATSSSSMAVHLERRDHGVAVVTLDDRARRNAMSPELGDLLRQRVRELSEDRDLRAVVLTGAGGAFSAGGDLAMLEQLRQQSFEESRVFMRAFYARYLSIASLIVPVIAAVDGPAIGAGLCVALACDLTIVSEDARLALNFVQLGLHPGMGATYFVPRRVGHQRATELLMTGRRFDGREAARIGLVAEAVPSAEVLPRALALADQIAAAGPIAVRALKQRLRPDADELEEALEAEARAQAESYGSADLGEGLAAAAARRAPVFTNR